MMRGLPRPLADASPGRGAAPTTAKGGTEVSTVIVVVTCELCGQSWQRRTLPVDQAVECIFCGCRGRLRVGPVQADRNGTQHAEAWLHCPRGSE